MSKQRFALQELTEWTPTIRQACRTIEIVLYPLVVAVYGPGELPGMKFE
jgi:hypothetical protein